MTCIVLANAAMVAAPPGTPGACGSGHAQLQASRVEKPRGDVLQLQRRQLRELLVDALEDVVVQVPRLVEFLLAPRLAVLLAPLVRLLEPAAVHLHEGNLRCNVSAPRRSMMAVTARAPEASRPRSAPEVQLRRLLERLVPRLVPQNGDADELERHHLGLLHEQRAVLPEVIQHHHRRRATRRGLRLTRDEQRVPEAPAGAAAPREPGAGESKSARAGSCCGSSRRSGGITASHVSMLTWPNLHQRRLHLGRRAVVEPQRQKTQNILKRPPFPFCGARRPKRWTGKNRKSRGRRDANTPIASEGPWRSAPSPPR